MSKLPEKQLRILDFIRQQHVDTGVYPSVREIAAHMEFKSTNTVDYHLRRMEANGILERGGRRARSFSTPKSSQSTVNDLRHMAHKGNTMTGQPYAGVPILGRVAAGEPILAEEHYEGHVNFENFFRCDDQTFALHVKGDSMVDAGIVEGDLVIVRSQGSVANGEIGVAMIDGEATVKRIFDEGKQWRLQPENETMKPIMVKKETSDFSIAGRVVGVVRKI